tara:strand:+ start:2294 stop:3241 length:948 start_codon:yes stop_codon:yes gene_type:complete
MTADPQAPSPETTEARPSSGRILSANAGLACVMLMWGSAFPLIEDLLTTWDVLINTTVRMAAGAFVLVSIFVVAEYGRIFRGPIPWGRVFLLGFFGFGVNTVIFTAGVANTGGANAAIVAALMPIIGAIAARVINGERLRRATVIAATIAFAGCLLVVVARAREVGEFRGGALLVLIAMSLWAWYSIQAQRWLSGWSQVRIGAMTATAGALSLAVMSVVGVTLGLAGNRHDFSPGAIAIIIYLAVTSNGVALVLWSNGVKVLGVTLATLFSNTIPMIAVAISFLFFDQTPLPLELVGGAVVIGGVIYGQMALLKR